MNIEKYRDLAYGSPRGLKLADLVEEHWDEWQNIVAQAKWFRHWKYSVLLNAKPTTPRDKRAHDVGCGSIPLMLYTTSVWEYGLWYSTWLKDPIKAIKRMYAMQTRRVPQCIPVQSAPWDPEYLVEGSYVPCEIADLDRWLESLWTLVLGSESVHTKCI